MAKLSHSLAVAMLALYLAASAQAQNTDVEQHGNTLKLRAEDAGVSIQLVGVTDDDRPIEGRLTVSPGGSGEATLNGQHDSLEFAGVSNVSVSFGTGENQLTVHAIRITGAIQVRGGPGGQAVVIESSQAKSLSFDAASGRLYFECADSHFAGKVLLKSGASDDFARVICNVRGSLGIALGEGDNVAVFGNLEGFGFQPSARSIAVKTGGGDDLFQLGSSSTSQTVKVDLGAGSNLAQLGGTGGPAGGVSYKGGDGPDVVELDDQWVDGKVKLALGGGENVADLVQAHVGDSVTVEGGSGPDVVFFTNSELHHGTTLKLGNGNNSLEIKDSLLRRKLAYAGGRDRDVSYGERLTLEGDASFRSGAPDHTVALYYSAVAGSLAVAGGSGMDRVELESSDVGEDAKLALGNGDNSVSLNQSAIGDKLSVTGGSGSDYVNFNLVELGDYQLRLGGGMNLISGTPLLRR